MGFIYVFSQIYYIILADNVKKRGECIIMKICPYCNFQNENAAKTCAQCGHMFKTQMGKKDLTPVFKDTTSNHAAPDTNSTKRNRLKNPRPRKIAFIAVVSFVSILFIALFCSTSLSRQNPDSITILNGNNIIDLKNDAPISINAHPDKFSSKSFECISSNPSVATVSFNTYSGNLIVSPAAEGDTKVKITYTASNGEQKTSNEISLTIVDKELAKKKAATVDQQIKNIGAVSLEHEDLVEIAYDSYLQLNNYAKGLVKEKNELDFAQLKLSELATATAEPVIKEIDSIGKVTKDCRNKVKSIRSQFNLLSKTAQSQVSNYDTLTQAETALKQIDEQEKKQQATASFKKGCAAFDYKSIARQPDNFIGKKAKFTGQVAQVIEDLSGTALRVNVTEDEYGLWSNTVYVRYSYPESSSPRILEDDIITMYGTLDGLETYTSTLGASVTIPALNAQYIDIQ
ncbi:MULTISPECIES: hypothetical protein [Caproicibacterium]|uniref:BIG2 domain-containing protein n=1 Tax=Caproicibacterium argilliputei TaxID=3030016 RepID=A0AA97DD99_9FIRM|nr:hypothetical protein [Caproicibacterium argilliputei]WOC33427.1 hypothetical protein PXC00_06065 [Caproicibacterium argilliputei]